MLTLRDGCTALMKSRAMFAAPRMPIVNGCDVGVTAGLRVKYPAADSAVPVEPVLAPRHRVGRDRPAKQPILLVDDRIVAPGIAHFAPNCRGRNLHLRERPRFRREVGGGADQRYACGAELYPVDLVDAGRFGDEPVPRAALS